MKTFRRLLLVCAALAGCAASLHADQLPNAMSGAAKLAGNSMAILRATLDQGSRENMIIGPAVCINAKGIFMTLAMDPRTPVASIRKIEIILPGNKAETLQARLLGIDPLTRLSFVQVAGARTFTPVTFAETAEVSLGQPVVSVGLSSQDPAYPVSLGAAYVGSILEVPQRLIYVTGGTLGAPGSVVFNEKGQAIGLVMSQLLGNYQMSTTRGLTSVAMKNLTESAYFTPVDNFRAVLEDMPTDGKTRDLPWLGINKFEAVPDLTAEMAGLKTTGVMIDQVIPGKPAAAAGLQNRDIIIALDGKPLRQMATPGLTVSDFVRRLMSVRVGRPVKIKYVHGTKTHEVTIKTIAMPDTAGDAPRILFPTLGFAVREKVEMDYYIDTNPARQPKSGLYVLAVGKDRPAGEAGLQTDDLILKANGTSVATVKNLSNVVQKALAARPTERLRLLVQRGNEEIEITVLPPDHRR